MRMIDFDRKSSLKSIYLYLTESEATQIKEELEKLLKDPEAHEHFHVCDARDPYREISCSIVTEIKLKNISRYNKLEQQVLSEK
ncbi:MAG: hypothetical protein JW943_15995 [Deltaproteobacteria bacterium]|nr:hypothetical protein [Deltaproteobacteria bacterium]